MDEYSIVVSYEGGATPNHTVSLNEIPLTVVYPFGFDDDVAEGKAYQIADFIAKLLKFGFFEAFDLYMKEYEDREGRFIATPEEFYEFMAHVIFCSSGKYSRTLEFTPVPEWGLEDVKSVLHLNGEAIDLNPAAINALFYYLEDLDIEKDDDFDIKELEKRAKFYIDAYHTILNMMERVKKK